MIREKPSKGENNPRQFGCYNGKYHRRTRKREIFEPSYHQVPGWQIDIRMIKPISSVRPDLPSMCWRFCEGRRRLTQINHSPSTSCINILYAPCITYLFAHVIYCCILLYIVIYCCILLYIVIYC